MPVLSKGFKGIAWVCSKLPESIRRSVRGSSLPLTPDSACQQVLPKHLSFLYFLPLLHIRPLLSGSQGLSPNISYTSSSMAVNDPQPSPFSPWLSDLKHPSDHAHHVPSKQPSFPQNEVRLPFTWSAYSMETPLTCLFLLFFSYPEDLHDPFCSPDVPCVYMGLAQRTFLGFCCSILTPTTKCFNYPQHASVLKCTIAGGLSPHSPTPYWK